MYFRWRDVLNEHLYKEEEKAFQWQVRVFSPKPQGEYGADIMWNMLRENKVCVLIFAYRNVQVKLIQALSTCINR